MISMISMIFMTIVIICLWYLGGRIILSNKTLAKCITINRKIMIWLLWPGITLYLIITGKI